MTNKLKVGVIGLGSMGSTHLDIYSKINDVESLLLLIQSRVDSTAQVKLRVILVARLKVEWLVFVLRSILMVWTL